MNDVDKTFQIIKLGIYFDVISKIHEAESKGIKLTKEQIHELQRNAKKEVMIAMAEIWEESLKQSSNNATEEEKQKLKKNCNEIIEELINSIAEFNRSSNELSNDEKMDALEVAYKMKRAVYILD